ncbi:MAG: hypothetical protein AAGD25_38245 [Cyanobacteria bacterium P01_F01_bin.150]
MSFLHSVNFASIIPILNNVVLVLAILGLLWFTLGLWIDVRDGETVIPYTVPFIFLFAIAIATVLIFHFSPLHLIWLLVVCLLASLPLMILPPVQWASMGFIVLLAGGGLDGFGPPDEQEREYIILEDDDLDDIERITSKKKKRQQQAIKSAKSSKKKSDKGFGSSQ